MALTFYTVDLKKASFPVKYIAPIPNSPNNQISYGPVKTFCKDIPFSDPSEACEEFQAWLGHNQHCYLDQATFRAKVKAIRLLFSKPEKTKQREKSAE